MSITKTRTKSGEVRYVVRAEAGTTRDGKRDRRRGTFRTLAEARAFEARCVAMADAMRGRSGRCTVEDYVERTHWPSAAGLAPTSRDTYRREIDKRILPALGRMDVRDVDRAAIQRMVDGCATRDVARKAVSVLKTILNEAKGDGLIVANPAEARFAMPEPGRKRDNGIVVTTFAGMAPLDDALAALGDDCTRRIAATGLYMGLRPEERYGLDWEDFSPDMRTARVERALVTASPAEGGVQLKGTKTEKSRRTVPVPARARRLLLASGRGEGPLIVGAGGGRISPSTARKRWMRFLRDAEAAGFDVPPVTVENMRHSFATSFLHAGGNVEDLSRILGHSDINTTYRRYVRPSSDDLVDAVESVLG